MPPPTPAPDAAVDELREALRGAVLEPGDAGYDAARRVWNARIDHEPDVIARPTGTADVLAAVTGAREHGLSLSAKGGGHHVSGTAVPDEGLLLDLGEMDAVDVDPDRRIARVQAGATWGDVDHETQAFGLAVPGGQDPNIGVAGLTLGGGVGWLSRKYGLTCDNLRAVELVTADGERVRASADRHPELFWGLRGGGGRFGVVTSFEYDLHEVGPEILAGSLAYPVSDAPAVARRYREFVADAPREANALFGLMALPPASHFPADRHGDRVAMLVVCYAGPPEEGRPVLEPLRSFGDPIADSIRSRRYKRFQRAGASRGSIRTALRSQHLETVTDEAIGTLVRHGSDVPADGATVFVSPRGGAVTDPDPDATAYPRREDAFHVLVEARWTDPADDDEHVEWVESFHEALRRHATGDVAMNFLSEDDPETRRRAAFGDDYERLRRLQREWDPDGLFRMTRGIDPTD
ncbi:FAD-binding oxidoreductase [Halopenitus persicus]|uniref:FAD/FMN-containing dehydrogenase n=1 Tax=Halopenitus persicus TaxID=1048396 RepID=A0A1H3J223_9EURY|nr:FAD-binding oxidoreductase [Halopenitus persicus]SDY33468.1 FAD/FMN-containing dehydrogenase [Halopenitus persicus]